MITLEASDPIDPVNALEALLTHTVDDITTPVDWSWKQQLKAAMQGIRDHLARTADLEDQVAKLTKEVSRLAGLVRQPLTLADLVPGDDRL
jgi:hypothetical protein